MSSTKIVQDDFQVEYDETRSVVVCRGSFRLHGDQYKPILDILFAAADARHPELKLDLTELQFLNSSGINTLSKFVLHTRKLDSSSVLVVGSSKFPWQEKSLKNLTRLMPSLAIEFI